jgi:hypothetical protein
MLNKLQYSTKLWALFGVSLLLVVALVYLVPVLASIPIIMGVYFFYSILKHYDK